MSLIRTMIAGTALAAATLTIATPAAAVVTTFATYSAASTAANVYWKKVGTGGSIYTTATGSATTAGTSKVNFNFLQPALAALGELKADFILNGTTTAKPAVSMAGYLIQSVQTGGFSFTYSGLADLHVGSSVYHHGANLLTAVYTGAAIVGGSGATSGSLSASTASDDAIPPTITFTSDFLDFTSTDNQDFALSLTSITNPLNRPGGVTSLRTFRASSSGAFSTDPAPTVTAVPEPAVWSMLFVGFGLIGVQVRKRRSTVVAA